MKEPEISCPKCGWRPRAEDRWACVPSCGTVWNTFWTRGVCPGCGIQWQKTQCLACGEVSPHKDWYHWPDGHETADEESLDARESSSASTDHATVDRAFAGQADRADLVRLNAQVGVAGA